MIGLHQVVWRSLLSMFAPHRKVILSYWQLVMTGHGFESYTSLLASSDSENAQCFGSTVSAIEAGWTVSMSPNVSKTYPNSPLRILFVSPSQLCSDHIDQNGNVFAPVRGLSETAKGAAALVGLGLCRREEISGYEKNTWCIWILRCRQI